MKDDRRWRYTEWSYAVRKCEKINCWSSGGLHLTILTVKGWDQDANLVACSNSFSRGTKEKKHTFVMKA